MLGTFELGVGGLTRSLASKAHDRALHVETKETSLVDTFTQRLQDTKTLNLSHHHLATRELFCSRIVYE
jgi:hypothetical protein